MNLNEINDTATDTTPDLLMVVLPGGFIYTGYLIPATVAGRPGWAMTATKNIKKFGTDGDSLGALANGPRRETQLDDVGTVLIPEGQLLHAIILDRDGWAKFYPVD